MTAQVGDILIYEGEEMEMATEIFVPHSSHLKEKIVFVAPLSCCWRGYFATWEIKNDELFLIDFRGTIEGYQKVGLDYIFPGQTEVSADWFTGEIRIPKGEILKYVHRGYATLCEEDLFLEFKYGFLVKSRIVDNRSRLIEYENELNSRKKISFWRNLFERDCK